VRGAGAALCPLSTLTVNSTRSEGHLVKPVIPLTGLAAGIALAAIVGATQALSDSGHLRGQVPPAVVPRLTAVAYRWAASEGDPSPTSVLAVRTTRAAALHLADPADTVPDSGRTPVYLVVERGHFHPTGLEGIRLPGTQVPALNLELILSVRNLEVLDFGLGRGGKHRPTVTLTMLQGLGPVSALDLRKQSAAR